MAILWPVYGGAPRAAGAAGDGAGGASRKAPKAGPKPADSRDGCCATARTPQAACKAFPAEITLYDKSCDGAFAHFMDTVASDDRIDPDAGKKHCWSLAADGHDRFIALLPDPIDTGMPGAFDEELVAVIKGFSERKYLLDRFWSPWHDRQLAAEDDPDAVSTCASRIPAVFTFRCKEPSATCRDAELFVVGENPTSGVDGEALGLALALTDRASTACEGTMSLAARLDPERCPLRIIGPNFSGSARSIARLLSDERLVNPARSVAFATGTASVSTIATTLKDVRPGRVTFDPFVLSSKSVEQGFLEYLRTRVFEVPSPRNSPLNPKPGAPYRWFPHVALISEALTLFGGSTTPANTPGLDAKVPDGKQSEECSSIDPCFPAVDLQFPLHIAALRNAFAQQDGSAAAPAAIGSFKLPSIGLHVEQDHDQRQDTPRLLSKATSVLDDVVLEQQFRVLAEEDVRIVGIFASDPSDALFLVRQLRRQLPDARLFVFDYDAAFEHPDYARELRGTLLMSSYPTTPRADRWVLPLEETSRRTFGSPTATGVFNATLWTIDPDTAPDHLLAYGVPFRAPPADMGPALWISAIGVTGAVPIHAIEAVDAYAMKIAHPAERPGASGCIALDEQNVFPSVGFSTVLSFLSLFFCGSSICACLALFGCPLPVTLRWTSFLRPPPEKLGYHWWWRIAALTGSVGHFLAIGVLGAFVATPLVGTGWCDGKHSIAFETSTGIFSARGLLAVDAGFLGLAGVLGGVFSVAIWHPDPREWLRRVWKIVTATKTNAVTVFGEALLVALILAVSMVAAEGAIATPRFYDFVQSRITSDADLPLAYVRWTDLQSQLSPIAPFLAITAILGIGASQYLVQAQRGGKHPRRELDRLFPFAKLTLPAQDLRRAASFNLGRFKEIILKSTTMTRWPFLGGSLFSFFIVVLLAPARFSTLERPLVTAILGVGIALSFVLTAGTLTASVTLVTSLKLFLVRLDAHPIAGRIEAVSRNLSVPVRLPFSSLPDTSQQIIAWLSAATAYLQSAHVTQAPNWLGCPVDEWPRTARGKDILSALRTIPRSSWNQLERAYEHAGRDIDLVAAGSEVDTARDFVAVHLLVFIFWTIRQVGVMVGFAITSSLLFALALASYPFHPARALSTVGAVTVVVSLATALCTFVMIERDDVLSKVSGTKSGRIQWDLSFLGQVAAWVILPFLAFLATQYPEEARSLVGWASPYVPGK